MKAIKPETQNPQKSEVIEIVFCFFFFWHRSPIAPNESQTPARSRTSPVTPNGARVAVVYHWLPTVQCGGGFAFHSLSDGLKSGFSDHEFMAPERNLRLHFCCMGH